jgi:hypothetical protein
MRFFPDSSVVEFLWVMLISFLSFLRALLAVFIVDFSSGFILPVSFCLFPRACAYVFDD